MAHVHPPAVQVRAHPITATFMAFPTACFTLALLTDVAYWQSGELMWQNFSEWLLLAGLVGGGLAAVCGLVEVLLRPVVRAQRGLWLGAFLFAVALALAVVNSFIHAGDGWTAVVPYGLALSAATVAVMVLSGIVDLATGRTSEVVYA
jgi:uncharacterized membrane protein